MEMTADHASASMDEDPGQIECGVHGLQDETFVCQHTVGSLRTRQAVGFHWPASPPQRRPDPWCSNCESRRVEAGGDWIEDVLTVAAFGALALLGLALVGFGAVRRARIPLVAGRGLLLTFAGAWVVGLPGVALGVVALGFWRRKRSDA
jgi:hypothetical protein